MLKTCSYSNPLRGTTALKICMMQRALSEYGHYSLHSKWALWRPSAVSSEFRHLLTLVAYLRCEPSLLKLTITLSTFRTTPTYKLYPRLIECHCNIYIEI